MSDKVEVILGVRNAELKQGLSQAKEWIADWRKEVTTPIAGALAAGGLISATENIMEYAKQVRNLSDAYGVSTTALQQWSGALGVDLEEVAGLFNDLTIAQAEALGGDDTKLKQFKELGITAEQLASMNVDELMLAIGRGMMDAAAMGGVMGEEAVRLRARLKALADGSLELGAAMQEGTVRGLAAAADEIAHMKQETSTGFGEFLLFLFKVNRSVWSIVTGLATIGGVMQRGITNAAPAALAGAFDVAKEQMAEAFKEAKIQAEAYKKELEATWSPEDMGATGTTSAFKTERSESNAAIQAQEREASLMERLMDLRRQAAMEEANDEEKMAQLLDREHELRLQAADLDESTTDGLDARIKVEEVVLKILQLQNQMADKAKQAREKEAQERKTQAEKFKRDQEAAEQRLRDEQDRATVMQAEVSLGDEAAQRLNKQLEYTNKIRDLEDKIVDARESGNLELATTLTRTQQLIRQQAQLASDPASQAFSKNGGRAPKVSDLRRQAEDRARQQRAQDKFRGRLVDGLIPTARDINGNPIEGIDPVTGERRKITPPPPAVDPFKKSDPRDRKPGELVGPPLPPGFDVNKPGQEKDPTGAKLDKINDTLTTIEKKLDKPLTHG